jgi:predicted HicB family RNase H-like nuclease
MTREKINPDGEYGFRLRMAVDLHDFLKELARANGRSLNAEIVWHLRQIQATRKPTGRKPSPAPRRKA